MLAKRLTMGLAVMALAGLVSAGCEAQGYYGQGPGSGYSPGPGYGYGRPPPPPPRDDERRPDGQSYGQGPRYDDRDRGNDRGYAGTGQTRQREQQYNQSITTLQQQHNQAVLSLQQQYNAGHLTRQQLDAGVARLGQQYGAGVQQQQRELAR